MRTEPTTAKGRATVARVLDAACELFARQGIRATTLDQVGALSRTGRGQLCLYAAAQQYSVDDPIRCPLGSLVHELAEQDGAARTALAEGFGRWQAELAGAAYDPTQLRIVLDAVAGLALGP